MAREPVEGRLEPARVVVGLPVDGVHEPVLGDVASDRLEARNELLRIDPALYSCVVVEVLRVVLLHRREVLLQPGYVPGNWVAASKGTCSSPKMTPFMTVGLALITDWL